MADFHLIPQREWESGQWIFLILLLDCSTSMRKYGRAPLNAINRLIESLRQANDGRRYACSVVTFSDHMHIEIPLTPVAHLQMHEYPSHRGTLLWQTAHQTIEHLLSLQSGWKSSPQPGFIIGVISDGVDNLSHEVYQSRLHATTEKALRLGWELHTFGIGIDAIKLALRMGFPSDPIHAHTLIAAAESFEESRIILTDRTSNFYKKPPE